MQAIAETIEHLLGALSPAAIVVLTVTICLAGFLRGFLGFGGSLLIAMIANIVFGPKVAVPLACLSGLPITIQLMPDAIRFSDRNFTIPFGLASLASIPVGTWILVTVDPSLMKVVVSACVLLMVVFLFFNWTPAYFANRTVSAITGAFSGLIQGAAGVGGPPAVALAMAHPGGPERQRGNVIGVVAFLGTAPLLPLAYQGLITTQVVILSICVFPLYLGTSWIGKRYFSGQGKAHYRLAALYAMGAVSVVTLAIALKELLQK